MENRPFTAEQQQSALCPNGGGPTKGSVKEWHQMNFANRAAEGEMIGQCPVCKEYNCALDFGSCDRCEKRNI